MVVRLRHLSLPGLTPYPFAVRLQAYLVATQLSSQSALSQHAPTLITLQHPPTYTTGRRQAPLGPDVLSALLQPLSLPSLPAASLPIPAYYSSPRGGLVTYHGPGQLTIYPIVSLRQYGLGVRGYIDLLEGAVIRSFARFGVRARADAINPGVWVGEGRESRKLASVGIHVRRGVASQGVGINIGAEVEAGFDRVEACGIPGVKVGWLKAEMIADVGKEGNYTGQGGTLRYSLRDVEQVVAQEMALGLTGDKGVERVDLKQVADGGWKG